MVTTQSLLKSLENALSESVLRVLCNINVFADAVDELVLLLVGELIICE